MFSKDHTIAGIDPEIAGYIEDERNRQEEHIELIASENFASPAVMEAQGSILTNKYAEGYPGRRYYGGCVHVDKIEQLAIDRAKLLFGAAFVNVQPHSGSQANQAVYSAVLAPGDKILGMALASGGHLTHGASVSSSGKLFQAHSYGLDADEDIDYAQVESLAQEHRPRMIVCGASAFSRKIDFARFRQIADSVGAYLLADIAHYAGLVATGLYPNPIEHAHFVTTTTHKTLRGPRGGMIMSSDVELGKKINSAIFPGIQGGPLLPAIAGKAVAFTEAMSPEFLHYQRQVVANAQQIAKILMDSGLHIVSGGTDTHMLLVDLTSFGITGKSAEEALERANITLNKNGIPNDPNPPTVTGGIRIGSPSITSRGFSETESAQVAEFIVRILKNIDSESETAAVREAVLALTKQFPIYEPRG